MLRPSESRSNQYAASNEPAIRNLGVEMIQELFSVQMCRMWIFLFFAFNVTEEFLKEKSIRFLITQGSLQQDYCLMPIRMFHFFCKLSGRVSAETAIF